MLDSKHNSQKTESNNSIRYNKEDKSTPLFINSDLIDKNMEIKHIANQDKQIININTNNKERSDSITWKKIAPYMNATKTEKTIDKQGSISNTKTKENSIRDSEINYETPQFVTHKNIEYNEQKLTPVQSIKSKI